MVVSGVGHGSVAGKRVHVGCMFAFTVCHLEFFFFFYCS